MVAAADAAEVEEAEQEEPIAGPSGLCGQRLDPAPSQDLVFADAMEEVCTIYIFFVFISVSGVGVCKN